MKFTFIKWAALCVAMLLALSGCNLVQLDPEKEAERLLAEAEKDAALIVATVGDEVITKLEAMQSLESAYDYYAAYGLSDRSQLGFLKEAVVEGMVSEKILNAKVKELGLDQYTDEETARFREEAQAEYDDQVSGYKAYLMDDGMSEEEAAAETDRVVREANFTVERLMEETMNGDRHERLREAVTKDVTVTDEDVRARYDSLVQEQTQTFEDGDEYVTERGAGGVIAYNPPGFRRVLNLLLLFSNDHSDKINDISAQIREIENAIYGDELGDEDWDEDDWDEGDWDIEWDDEEDWDDDDWDGEIIFDEDDEDDEEPTQGDDQTGDIIPEDYEEILGILDADDFEIEIMPEPTLSPEDQAKINTLELELAAAREAARADRQADLDEVLTKLSESGDFVAVMEQFGEDDGMKYEPTKSEGYFVSVQSTYLVEEFVEASMALEKVGDVSEPFVTDYGVHIVYYLADVPAGPVDFTTVADELSAQVLETAKGDAYDAAVEQWKADTVIELHLDVLD